MRMPRYSLPALFYKLSEEDQEIIISGFSNFYSCNAINPLRFDNKFLTDELIIYFERYHDTRLFKRLFNDLELVTLIRNYIAEVLDEDVVIEKYPELFV